MCEIWQKWVCDIEEKTENMDRMAHLAVRASRHRRPNHTQRRLGGRRPGEGLRRVGHRARHGTPHRAGCIIEKEFE